MKKNVLPLALSLSALLLFTGCASSDKPEAEPTTSQPTEITEEETPEELANTEFGKDLKLENDLAVKINPPAPLDVVPVDGAEVEDPYGFEVTITNNSPVSYAQKANFTLVSGGISALQIALPENYAVQPAVIKKGESATFMVAFDMANADDYILTVWTSYDTDPFVVSSAK